MPGKDAIFPLRQKTNEVDPHQRALRMPKESFHCHNLEMASGRQSWVAALLQNMRFQ